MENSEETKYKPKEPNFPIKSLSTSISEQCVVWTQRLEQVGTLIICRPAPVSLQQESKIFLVQVCPCDFT